MPRPIVPPAVALCLLVTAGCAAGAADQPELVGMGASSQTAAMDGWKAGFAERQSGFVLAYDPIGSGGGREAFLAGGAAFAGSDVPLDDAEYAEAAEACAGEAGAIDLPVYVSPIAVVYNLPSLGDAVLNLPTSALAGVFAGTVTRWDDPLITAANPGVELPATIVNPVHRSDDSGTTKNFTGYLAAVAPTVWTYGAIESWNDGPRHGEAADGTSGVVQAVATGEGSIGYADASQAGSLGVAAVQVGDAGGGEYVGYSPEAAAAVLTVSSRVAGRGPYDFTYDLRYDVPGTYPIVLVSYHIACLEYADPTTATRVREFLRYVVSEDGQRVAQLTSGSAPLPPALAADLAVAIDAIGPAS